MGVNSIYQKKPGKWGYKLWCRAGISGYVYNFELVGSPDAKGSLPGINIEHVFGETENVVLRLLNDLQDGQHKLFLTIFFQVQNCSSF